MIASHPHHRHRAAWCLTTALALLPAPALAHGGAVMGGVGFFLWLWALATLAVQLIPVVLTVLLARMSRAPNALIKLTRLLHQLHLLAAGSSTLVLLGASLSSLMRASGAVLAASVAVTLLLAPPILFAARRLAPTHSLARRAATSCAAWALCYPLLHRVASWLFAEGTHGAGVVDELTALSALPTGASLLLVWWGLRRIERFQNRFEERAVEDDAEAR